MAKAQKNAAVVTKAAKATDLAPIAKAMGATKGKAKASKAPKSAPKAKASVKATVKPIEVTGKPTDNPYREGGSYHACVEAIRSMGAANRFYAFDTLLTAYKKIVGSNAWKAFADKPQRNDNGLKAEERVFQNFTVICRKDKYGDPLRSCGIECRKEGKTFGLFKLGK